MWNIILVGFGGFAGSVLRYSISLAIASVGFRGVFPVATFIVNVVGSMLIGVLLGLFVRAEAMSGWYYLCVVGFCGGFTTFSTFSFEVLELMHRGVWWAGLGYAMASVVLCVCAVGLGMRVIGKI